MSNAHPTTWRKFGVVSNTGWNLLAAAVPVAVAVFTIPRLIDGLGMPRFGVLTISWVVVNYFAQCNLGLGLATMKFAAEMIHRDQRRELAVLVWSSVVAHAVIGVIAACALALLAQVLSTRVLATPLELQSEAVAVLLLLAATLPASLVSDCMRSLLAAQHRFDLIAAVQAPSVALNYLSPLAVLPFSHSLVPMVAVILASRIAVMVVFIGLNLRLLPALRTKMCAQWAAVGRLLGLGGWLTVSSLVMPTLMAMDRFVIGAVVSLTAVAWYATPYEVVTKMWLFSGSLLYVLFPTFSALGGTRRQAIPPLYWRAVAVLSAMALLAAAVLVVSGPALLRLWLGAEFARHGGPVVRWLAIGVAINVVANAPSTLLQSTGKAHLPAILQLIELPLYAVAVWTLAATAGIAGVAAAWTLRAAVDAVLLFVVAGRAMASDAAATAWDRLPTCLHRKRH